MRRAAALAAAAALGSAAATPALAAAGGVHHYTFFLTPSRNIGCVIISGTARCDIVSRAWSPPPRPRSCSQIVDYGQGLTVGATGPARVVCAGDTARDPRAHVLAYGEADAAGALRCTSAPAGVTCRSSRSGHGFFISRQRYRLF